MRNIFRAMAVVGLATSMLVPASAGDIQPDSRDVSARFPFTDVGQRTASEYERCLLANDYLDPGWIEYEKVPSPIRFGGKSLMLGTVAIHLRANMIPARYADAALDYGRQCYEALKVYEAKLH